MLLPDPAAAREAFRELVTTVDACPKYSQVNAGVDGATWTAQPAIEGQGVYPSIVQEITLRRGHDAPAYRGHMLVGNTIVTWTAESRATIDQDAALATLGDPRPSRPWSRAARSRPCRRWADAHLRWGPCTVSTRSPAASSSRSTSTWWTGC